MLPYYPPSKPPPVDGPNPFRTDSPPPPPEFERRRQEKLPLVRQTDIICKVVDQVLAVARIPGRGSGVLVSKAGLLSGVLLTTPAVLESKEDADGATAIFFETRVLNGRKQLARCEVPLRPEKLFYSSLPEPRHGKRLRTQVGYVLVACDLYGKSGGHVDVPALPLPLLKAGDLAPKESDVCLIVQHPNGNDKMKYHVNTVDAVRAHHVEFSSGAPDEASTYVASGGGVFDTNGRLIGIGHLQGGPGGVNVAILLGDIVTHMYRNRLLGVLHFNVKDVSEDCRDHFDRDAERIVRGPEDDGFFWGDLWDEWVDTKKIDTVVMCLYAWPDHARLQIRALTELTCHEQRHNVQRIAELGALEAALRALSSLPSEVDVVEAAMLTLGRASECAENRSQQARLGTTARVLAAMADYPDVLRIQQWGCYTILQLVQKGEKREEDRESFVAKGGLDVVGKTLHAFSGNTYSVRWAAALLGSVCEYSPDFLAAVHERKLPEHFVEVAGKHLEDAAALEALLGALCVFTDDWGNDDLRRRVCSSVAAADGFLPVIGGALSGWTGASGGVANADILTLTCTALGQVMEQCDSVVPLATDADIERKVVDAVEECPVSLALLGAACRVCTSLGVDVEDRFSGNTRLREVRRL
eukprot:TRINITY_DN2210_c7_g1_i1.p1 TRINITY_DN2210_c7_g1~~TRINITY_DN2210_c7_g1_i1.p1  ORF type:complete len:641 (+),score=192.97 TRINITY_DN2210_c7_g1_i1:64-1986(+)